MKTTFKTSWQTEFGFAVDERKGEVKETSEETFKNFLNTLPKKIQKTWGSITFDFNGQEIQTCKHWLIETDFNWEESHEILNNED